PSPRDPREPGRRDELERRREQRRRRQRDQEPVEILRRLRGEIAVEQDREPKWPRTVRKARKPGDFVQIAAFRPHLRVHRRKSGREHFETRPAGQREHTDERTAGGTVPALEPRSV